MACLLRVMTELWLRLHCSPRAESPAPGKVLLPSASHLLPSLTALLPKSHPSPKRVVKPGLRGRVRESADR